MSSPYIPPEYRTGGFNCPYCGAYAHQVWYEAVTGYSDLGKTHREIEGLEASQCMKCDKNVIWFDENLLFPISSDAPMPSEDMPENVSLDYSEAREIVNRSPRSAAALLRLSMQKLMQNLGEKGKDLNADIANLVKEGLPSGIQKALDSVRVIGNNAVHPGEIDIKDDRKTALTIFELCNMIVDVMITRPKKIDKIFDMIPEGAKKAIKKRNNK